MPFALRPARISMILFDSQFFIALAIVATAVGVAIVLFRRYG
jgi:hypothetical protein